MKKDKKSFVLYADMVGVVSKLPDEKAGQLLKLILSHVNGEECEVEDLMLDIAFEPIKAQLTRDAEKWANTCKARSEAGKKGGRPKKQAKAKQPIGFFEKQNKAKKADNVNDTDNDTVSVIDNVSNNTSIEEASAKTSVDNPKTAPSSIDASSSQQAATGSRPSWLGWETTGGMALEKEPRIGQRIYNPTTQKTLTYEGEH